MQVFERYVSPHEFLVFAFEILLIPGALVLAVFLQQPGGGTAALWKVLPAAVLCQLCLYYNDFYDLRLLPSGSELIVRLIQAVGATTFALGIVYLFVPSLAIHPAAALRSLTVLGLTVLAWRLLFNRLVTASAFVENTLVIGTGVAARAVAKELVAQHAFAYRVIGFVDDAPDTAMLPAGLPLVGRLSDIPRLVRRHDLHRILVALPDRGVGLPAEQLVTAKLSGVVVEDAVAAYEQLTGKVLLEGLKLRTLVFAQGFDVSRRRRIIKRAWDLSFSAIGLVLASPIIGLTALAVWISSGRPVLYRQERVGQQNALFTLYKFRSMRLDAEASGPVWARADDDRVTPVGRFIRLTRLDELPQLWNVLMGHMSFVGPRPERPFFVNELAKQTPFYNLRHAVKPGITGWAQVRYRYADSLESAIEKLRYDLYYVKHLSTAFDLTIVLDTVKTIVLRMGSH
jgi:sugar transferase (PEP-CTERM system associated)